MDLLLGGFADAHIDDVDITAFETLLDAPDPDLYVALTSGAACEGNDAALLARIRDFHFQRHRDAAHPAALRIPSTPDE